MSDMVISHDYTLFVVTCLVVALFLGVLYAIYLSFKRDVLGDKE